MYKKRVFLALVLFIVLISVISIFLFYACRNRKITKNFIDNGKVEPYSQNIPLHEMDLTVYNDYVNLPTTLPGYENQKLTVILPCDIHYYALKTDAEPTLTLKAGTEVYIRNESGKYLSGYGFTSWPDYEMGWRYAYPFQTETFKALDTEAPMYYVRMDQLEEVVEEIYRIKDGYNIRSNLSKREVIKSSTLYIDELLYVYGAYCSEYLLNP